MTVSTRSTQPCLSYILIQFPFIQCFTRAPRQRRFHSLRISPVKPPWSLRPRKVNTSSARRHSVLCFMSSVHDTVARHEAREEGAPSLTKGSDYAPTATPGRDATSRIQARAALGPGSECTRLPEGGPPDQGVPRGTSRPRVGHVRPTRPRRSARPESQVRRGDIVTVAKGKPP